MLAVSRDLSWALTPVNGLPVWPGHLPSMVAGSKGECPKRARWTLYCFMILSQMPHSITSTAVCYYKIIMKVSPYSRGRGFRLHFLMGRMSRNLQTSFKMIAQHFPEPRFPEPPQSSNTTGHPTHHPMTSYLVHLLGTLNSTMNPHERETKDSRCPHIYIHSLKMFLQWNMNPFPKVNPLPSPPS